VQRAVLEKLSLFSKRDCAFLEKLSQAIRAWSPAKAGVESPRGSESLPLEQTYRGSQEMHSRVSQYWDGWQIRLLVLLG